MPCTVRTGAKSQLIMWIRAGYPKHMCLALSLSVPLAATLLFSLSLSHNLPLSFYPPLSVQFSAQLWKLKSSGLTARSWRERHEACNMCKWEFGLQLVLGLASSLPRGWDDRLARSNQYRVVCGWPAMCVLLVCVAGVCCWCCLQQMFV